MLARRLAVLTVLPIALTATLAGCGKHAHSTGAPAFAPTPAASTSASGPADPSPTVTAPATATAPATPSPAAAAGAKLPVITYAKAPGGFPADPEQTSTTPLTEGLHPVSTIPVYDAVGGTARAYLAPAISGAQLVMPIVARQSGWVAVILPSVNRTVGWLPEGAGWVSVQLHDQVVVHRSTFQLSWVHDGVPQQQWTVTVGANPTPTPLGRTFVLGRSHLASKVYAGLDVLALGAVPDNPGAVATGLAGAHTGIHAWYQNDFGVRKSNGCLRMPPAAQQVLLGQLTAGTSVVVLP